MSLLSGRRFRRCCIAPVVLLAAGCAQSAQDQPVTVSLEPEHVHALANNPDNGIVYAATHVGIFRLGSGGPQRVGDSLQDVVGFAVLGPGRFVSSGHPGPGEGGPKNVGLIRSDDGGLSWSQVALAGQTDFHALSVHRSVVYGWDSTSSAVLRSDDAGLTWQWGARVSEVEALAVDPDNVRKILAAGGAHLLESIDGGATFAPAPVQPPCPLVLVDHAGRVGGGGDTVLAGVDRNGTVWSFADGAWSRHGSTGTPPEAFTVLGPGRYAVATGGRILASEDAGRTWTLLATMP